MGACKMHENQTLHIQNKLHSTTGRGNTQAEGTQHNTTHTEPVTNIHNKHCVLGTWFLVRRSHLQTLHIPKSARAHEHKRLTDRGHTTPVNSEFTG